MANEALFFNTPTIFINENALNGYRKLIDDRSFYYASNREEMHEKLNAVCLCTFEDTVKYFAGEEDLCFSSLGDLENYLDKVEQLFWYGQGKSKSKSRVDHLEYGVKA